MTQEDMKLLLKDLCARQPYGVKIDSGGIGKTLESITIKPDYIEIVIKGVYAYCHFIHKDTGEWDTDDDFDRCKPYLRPMSSMTEEEEKEYLDIDNLSYSCPMAYAHVPASDRIDWLNRYHFDYHGLIPKGLAIEAPDGMYN